MPWRISLLTCQPHEEVYSIYGHTAIRYQDVARGTDIAVNYGMFSFHKPYFVLRFVFGLTDYEMGIESFDTFCAQYASYGSGVYEQVLNLTPEEKLTIAKAIDTNYEPQNRVYRYNYFYDNCTTRARDMITNHLQASVEYGNEKAEDATSYRQIVHQCASQTPWIRFGNDMLLGIKADLPIDRAQRQFLPANLMNDFERATLKQRFAHQTQACCLFGMGCSARRPNLLVFVSTIAHGPHAHSCGDNSRHNSHRKQA